jgi:hypothetical protein
MGLTKKELEMLDTVMPTEHGGSKATSQYLHGLIFSSGKTIANLEYVSDIPYKGHVEDVAVRDWNYEKFQIIHGVSSAKYPPTAHIMEIKAGIVGVIMNLEGGNKDYGITIEVPKARLIGLPRKYEFFHTRELDDLRHSDYVLKDRLGIRDWYSYKERGEVKCHVGDTFGGGYTLPEDVEFLKEFLKALKKIKPPTREQLEYIRDLHTPG